MITVTKPNLRWDWKEPSIRCGAFGIEVMDPFPAYGHDLAYVQEVASRVEAICPVKLPVAIYCPENETVTRTNGWTDFERGWNEKTNKHFLKSAWIVLSGKRIPLHPAMTRYLVAHEYGHVVEGVLREKRGVDLDDRSVFIKEYSELRRLENRNEYYGGGTWHSTPMEVFANDFRILVCKMEEEYWPHPGIERPVDIKIIRWWEDAVKELQR